MNRPTLAIVHNNIDTASSIGAIARWNVTEALERGWDVVAVCRDLDPALVGHVRHVPLYVPPRLHLVQWAAARATVKAALRQASYDVLLVHQAQLAAIADLWNVHYLSRAARDVRGPLLPGWRARVSDLQAAGVARLEDRYLSRLPESTRVIFCSEVTRDDFTRLYGRLENAIVLPNPALIGPVPDDLDLPDRALRASLVGDHPGPVVGFLGGGDPRKGGDLLVRAVAAEPGLFLLHAGSPGLDTSDPRLAGRTRDLGYLTDVSRLLHAIDVLVVPSRFEPFGLVVTEAAARGVPVLVGPQVGAASFVVESGAGVVWEAPVPLGPAVRDLVARRAHVAAAGRALARELSPHALGDRLFAEIEAAVASRRRGGDRRG